MELRDATAADFAAVLELNAASVELLSPLDRERLQLLHGAAAWHRVIEEAGEIAAFLLAFRECASYDSVNYRWFCRHYPRFLYVDRVVVCEQHRGRGFGRRLYEDAIAYCRRAEIGVLCCEYYLEPLNETSARFHAGFGFAEVGTLTPGDDGKRVSLQTLML